MNFLPGDLDLQLHGHPWYGYAIYLDVFSIEATVRIAKKDFLWMLMRRCPARARSHAHGGTAGGMGTK
jgi:hypothetical protein